MSSKISKNCNLDKLLNMLYEDTNAAVNSSQVSFFSEFIDGITNKSIHKKNYRYFLTDNYTDAKTSDDARKRVGELFNGGENLDLDFAVELRDKYTEEHFKKYMIDIIPTDENKIARFFRKHKTTFGWTKLRKTEQSYLIDYIYVSFQNILDECIAKRKNKKKVESLK